MQHLDWIIFIGYLVFVFLIGIAMTRKASKGVESYFVADRSMPWWWLGISIIATTFAADTPLAITGITANNGIVGNWFWWSWAATYITVAIFFAKRWRNSKVLTDVEFIELRYDGPQAAGLRGFKAFFFGVIINCFILGWVITAAVKIAGPFILWDQFAPGVYGTFASFYPAFLLFKGDINATLTILSLILIVWAYSSLGGIRGVIVTDLFQFAIAIITSIIFAYYAVSYVGGTEQLLGSLENIYGADKAGDLTQIIPSFDNPLLPFQVFLIYIVIQWWVRYDSDGTGYIAQRINTAKSPEDAQKGSLLFAVAFIALRTWPWIMVALVSLVVYPTLGGGELFMSEIVAGDREMAYPVLMKKVLPVGLLGLTFTSLMAAFMSTVDTHLNWGASYLANDIYRRFINPKATQKNLIAFSRLMVWVITIIAILVSSQMESISGAWKFFINAAAGLGVAHIMRWLWWRANAYTEISSMITAVIATILVGLLKPETAGSHYETYALVFIALSCVVVSVIVTLLTPAVQPKVLRNFIEKCEPVGIWKNAVLDHSDFIDDISMKKVLFGSFAQSVYMWVVAMTLSFSALFSIGYFLLNSPIKGAISATVSVLSYVILNKLIKAEKKSLS